MRYVWYWLAADPWPGTLRQKIAMTTKPAINMTECRKPKTFQPAVASPRTAAMTANSRQTPARTRKSRPSQNGGAVGDYDSSCHARVASCRAEHQRLQ